MISVQVVTVDKDQRYWDLIRTLEDDAVHVDIGIHPVSGEKMVTIASANEFGAVINNPGGQPFFITDDPKWRDVPNSALLDDGSTMVFLAKGKSGMGETKPHEIVILARPFIRSTVDDNRERYAEMMSKFWQQIMDGEIGIQQALELVGNQVEGDVKATMVALKTPGNAPSTIRKKKGVDNPLIDTGAMLNSVRWAVKNIQESLVEMGPGQ